MKETLQHLLSQALLQAFPEHVDTTIHIERPKDASHGDFASNLPLLLAKPCKKAPMAVAEQLVSALPSHPQIAQVAIAAPGFINFVLKAESQQAILNSLLSETHSFDLDLGKGQRIFLEYVSSNPTGPLHVGHGRSAAFGASLANILHHAGYDVHREYYVNDAGRQMDILGTSLWLRYLALEGLEFPFPTNAYRGDYVKDMALALKALHGDRFIQPVKMIFENLPADEIEPGVGDKEIYIDALIARAKHLLGPENYAMVFDFALNTVLDDIKQDLTEFNVIFDEWFSEKSLMTSGAIPHALDVLKKQGHLYEKDGALWFRSTTFGDDKDRCVVRDNGQSTYFASDIAYMLNKFERGAEQLVYIFGADHHGYLPRLRACIEALGHQNNDVIFEIVQFAVLYRGAERVQMSTRSGSFVTLRELRQEVGSDAARFFYVLRKADQHMDFDLELAKSKSNENPVYYIQYAHARICAVFKQLAEKGFTWNRAQGLAHADLLTTEHEQALLKQLSTYEEIRTIAVQSREPHRIALYLRELAHRFHSNYNANIILVPDEDLRNARLCLAAATQRILAHGLTLLNVSAPESM